MLTRRDETVRHRADLQERRRRLREREAAALVARLKTVVDKETANAADPKVTTALQALIATLAKAATPEGLAA